MGRAGQWALVVGGIGALALGSCTGDDPVPASVVVVAPDGGPGEDGASTPIIDAAVTPSDGATPDADSGSVVDVPCDAIPRMLTFGERPGSDVMNVTSDVTLFAGDGQQTFNYGAATGLGPDSEPIQLVLVRFDLARIPPTCKIASAVFKLWTQTGQGCAAGAETSVQLFRMLDDWQEGGGDGSPGAASYIERKPGVPWTAPGVGPGSREGNPFRQFNPVATSTEYQIDLTDRVGTWVEFPSLNHGFMMKMSPDNGDGTCFVSSESTVEPEHRPVLVVAVERDGG